MIEAVNSSLAGTQALRGNVEQVSTSRVVADIAPPASNSVAEAPKAPYVSPYIAIDTANNKAVIQIRDSDTGDVQDQFPSQSRLAQISQQQAREVNTQKAIENAVPEVQEAPQPSQTTDIVTVQDVTSSAPSNASLPSPEIAAAALSAAAQSSVPTSTAGVNVSA